MKKFISIQILFAVVLLCGCNKQQSVIRTTGMEIETTVEPHLMQEIQTSPPKNITEDGVLEYILVDKEVIITFAADIPKVVIPETIQGFPVVTLADKAFYQKFVFESISLPNTLKKIETGAFYRSYMLKDIVIPASVVNIEDGAFFRTSGIENFWVEEGNPNYCDIDGVLYDAEKTRLIAYPEGRREEKYEIPEGVTTIADSAFGYHPHLKFLKIPNSVLHFPEGGTLSVFDSEIKIIAESGSAAEAFDIARREK